MRYKIQGIDIVGFKQVPASLNLTNAKGNLFLPRVLTPIYRVWKAQVYPYVKDEKIFMDNLQIPSDEFEELVQRERVSVLDKPFAAYDEKLGYKLYLKANGQVGYNFKEKCEQYMSRCHKKYKQLAIDSFHKYSFEDAIVYCRVARSANPKDTSVLTLKAAILKFLDKHDEVDVCYSFAASKLNRQQFNTEVKDWLHTLT
jgi:hypothetical protein